MSLMISVRIRQSTTSTCMLSPNVRHKSLKPLRIASGRLNATRLLLEGSLTQPSSSAAMGLHDGKAHPKAPWRDQLSSHLQQAPGYEFTVATVGHDARGRAVPRVRTCGCRGFFPELKLHPSGQKDIVEQVEGSGNPKVYESDLLTFTTDVRMEKLHQLDTSEDAIEATFWLKDLMIQWRVKGTALSIGSPSLDSKEESHRKQIGDWLRFKEQTHRNQNWTWDKAVTEYFANHSPVMRGSFKNPPPGQPRSRIPETPELKLGQKVNDLHDPVARANFRVVAIIPEETELLDLSNPEDVRRRKWELHRDTNGNMMAEKWVETELWP